MANDRMIEELVLRCAEVGEEATAVRKMLRRRTKASNPIRVARLHAEVTKIEKLMPEVRSMMGRLPYLHLTEASEESLRATSRRLQMERHQMLKMLGKRS